MTPPPPKLSYTCTLTGLPVACAEGHPGPLEVGLRFLPRFLPGLLVLLLVGLWLLLLRPLMWAGPPLGLHWLLLSRVGLWLLMWVGLWLLLLVLLVEG